MDINTEVLDEAPTRFVTRVRNGKVIRRVRVRTVKKRGYKMRGARVIRETSTEARNRRRGAIRGARKRRSKRSQIARKRKRSLVRRMRLHIKPRRR
jgi:hypothetical protein